MTRELQNALRLHRLALQDQIQTLREAEGLSLGPEHADPVDSESSRGSLMLRLKHLILRLGDVQYEVERLKGDLHPDLQLVLDAFDTITDRDLARALIKWLEAANEEEEQMEAERWLE